ncbi:MAG TPA: DUF2381 family protein [Myxococcaceae bacterium]|nr:DUF2381 family protein [Myxococcaceae bacterium]
MRPSGSVGDYLGGPAILFQPCFPPWTRVCLLVCLASTAGATPAALAPPRPVVLTGKPGEAPLIHLAPGSFTLIILDAPIVRESVQVEGHDRFARVDPSDQGITLALAGPLKPTERLALRFTYREGFPSSALLLLTGRLEQPDIMVSVSRPPQTIEACQVELTSQRERCEAQRKELDELKARPATLDPAVVGLTEWGDMTKLRVLDLETPCLRALGELRVSQCRGFETATWIVAVFEVTNSGSAPWAPAWAELTPMAGGPPRRAHQVLSRQASIAPGGTVGVSVEVRLPTRSKEKRIKELHMLRVCDAAGSRCLSMHGVEL